MTEKRFINVNHEIWQDGEVWCIARGEHCADVIATALNEQHETITKQQERIHSLMKYNLECDDKVKETLQSFSNRDLLDIERIFLNNLCDELGVDLE